MATAACAVRSHLKRILVSIVWPSPTGDAGSTSWRAVNEGTEAAQERPLNRGRGTD